MPPRHGKSELISFWGPIWAFDRRPDLRVIMCSHTADLAAGFARRIRNELLTQEDLRVRLAVDGKRANLWHTTAKGTLAAAGVGGSITGKGADILIIDDPFKDAAESMSPRHRERVWDWYTSTARTRLEPGGSVIIVHTRWHVDDLAGRVLDPRHNPGERFELHCLPALAVEGAADPLGRLPGEALWPERFDADALASIRGSVGPRVWEALFQQAPTMGGDGYFPRLEQWPQYHERPDLARMRRIALSIDATYQAGPASDWCVIQVWGLDREGRLWLLDQHRERMGFLSALDRIESFRATYPRLSAMVIEKKANGYAIIEAANQRFPQLQQVVVNPQGSKESRAAAAESYVRGGRVLIPAPSLAPWVLDYAAEHAGFPMSAHDDQVDATCQMIVSALIAQDLGAAELDLGGIEVRKGAAEDRPRGGLNLF